MNNKSLKITIISNIVLQPYLEPLIKNIFESASFNIDVDFINYEEIECKLSDDYFNAVNIVVTLLNFDAMYPNYLNEFLMGNLTEDVIIDNYISNVMKVMQFLVHTSSYNLLILPENYYENTKNVIGYTYQQSMLIDKLNAKIATEILSNVDLIDLKHIIAEIGIGNAYDFKNKYRWNMPYSKELQTKLADAICKRYLCYISNSKKCLILDCDNVLWGGILLEDGYEGIKIGQNGVGKVYNDFQKFVLYLYYHGIIIAICSKNEITDIEYVFDNHTGMVLRQEHIACLKANWNNKSNNIIEISNILNIDMQSMVFVDDSPNEILEVQACLPQVTSICFNPNTIYEEMSVFNLGIANVMQSKIRTDAYRTKHLREEVEKNCVSFADYERELCLNVNIKAADPTEYMRISELSQRTNKCTNGKRYTVEEIKTRTKKKNISIYSVYLSDRFSDFGLVGALEVENNCLELFTLSCRAMGKNIEPKMLDFIFFKHKINNAFFTHTLKNDNIYELIKRYLASEDGKNSADRN